MIQSFIIIFIAVTTLIYLYPAEHFAEAVSKTATADKTGAAKTAEDEYVTVTGLNLLTTPLYTAVNNVVEAMNNIPSKLYENSITMSKKIGGKIKEYSETMKVYNRSKDDSDGLKTVSINKRHKLYINNLRFANDPLYPLLSRQSDQFYTTKFEDQDDALVVILTDLGKYHSKVPPLLAAKLQSDIS